MPTIVDALKAKYPDATGNTIADVINNSGSGSSGGGIEDFKAIPFVSTGGFIKSFNPQTVGFFEYYTYEELRQLMDENVFIYAYAINDAESRGFSKLVVNSGVICAKCATLDSWYDSESQDYKGYMVSYDVALTSENEFTCNVHNWYFPVTNDD